MQITAIKQQVKRAGRYSIFVDGKYSFSLSDTALLDSHLVNGQEISKHQLAQYKQLSNQDKLYNQVLNYVALRPRSKWEIETYLRRKSVEADLKAEILDKLSQLDLINDKNFARSWVSNRQLLRPTSKRKLTLELKQKHISDDVIQQVISDLQPNDERTALQAIINSKRRQTRYQDDQKLMQYLARQGFGYSDIVASFKR